MPITLKVKDVIDDKVVSIDAGEPIENAVKKMLENKVWSLVVEKRGLPQGVVTERDVIRKCLGKGLSPATTPVGKIMSSPLITIGPDAPIREAMDVMAAKEIRRLFVVEKGKIIGRVTQTALFDSTLSVMEVLSSLTNQL